MHVPIARRSYDERALAGFRLMWLMRRFDERAVELRLRGKIAGVVHSYAGQEAIAAGVCAALESTDRLATHHRGHGHALAKGADPAKMMAELFGAASGCCRGKGGSMHIADKAVRMLGANGMVGGSAGIAVGSALATRLAGGREVTVCFFGDGATGQGVVYEAMNLASLWRLPVVFVCENNGYAAETPLAQALAASRFADVGKAFQIRSEAVDGNDFYAVLRAADKVVAHARAQGPALLECFTYRRATHSQRGRPAVDRRDPDEVARWRGRDPIARIEGELREAGLGDRELEWIRHDVDQQLEAAVALAAGEPPPAEEIAFEDVYAPSTVYEEKRLQAAGPATMADAFVRAAADAMRVDSSAFFMATDVPEALATEFGAKRVRRAPISEAALTGAAVGAALCGARPILWLRNAAFSFVAFDQLLSQAAKLRYMSGGQYAVPLTVWVTGGAGMGSAAQHSTLPYALYAHTPGLRVVAPSCAADAYGLMRSSIDLDDPVIVVGSFRLNDAAGTLDGQPERVGIGSGRIARQGTDVTVVAASSMVELALEAAAAASADGIELDVIDLRTIAPLDSALIRSSVRRTGRLVVVDEAPSACSLSAEVVAVVAEDRDTFAALTASVERVTAADAHVPYSPALEAVVLPSLALVLAAVRRTVGVPARARRLA